MDGFKSQVGLSHKRGGEAVLENKRRKSAILLLSSTRFDHLLVLYILYIKKHLI